MWDDQAVSVANKGRHKEWNVGGCERLVLQIKAREDSNKVKDSTWEEEEKFLHVLTHMSALMSSSE